MALFSSAGVVALAVIAAVVQMGQAILREVPQVIEVEQFVIRDSSGTVRGELAVRQTVAFLGLNYSNGNARTRLIVLGDGAAALDLYDGNRATDERSQQSSSQELSRFYRPRFPPALSPRWM